MIFLIMSLHQWWYGYFDLQNDWLIDWFLVFNATFNNSSAISWRPVLMWKKPEYPERTTDHRQATDKLYYLRLRVECTLFCNLQSRARTHTVLLIGLYELIGNNHLTWKGGYLFLYWSEIVFSMLCIKVWASIHF